LAQDRFPGPFEIEPPEGAEGWEELYSYADVFSEDRRAYEDGAFWFQDSVHWGWALTPFDGTLMTWCLASLSQYNSRVFKVPPSQGVDARILNGYAYLSPVEIADGGVIEGRVPAFVERAGHYFQNWDSLYASWLEKVQANIAEIEALDFSALPESEPLEVVTEGRGVGSGWELLSAYRRFKDLTLKVWQLHFEFLNLGYAAYLDFFGFCKQAFPSIPDLAIARMVAGIEVDLFRPNEELKILAQKAIDLGVARAFDRTDDASAVQAALAETEQGRQWQADWDAVKDPWFNFSDGTGFYHFDTTWIDKPETPYGFIATYIEKLESGEDIARPKEAIQAERDRIVEEYGDLLESDEDRQAFQEKLGLARTVFPYVENHNFYIEHWSMSVWWRKLRELGTMLAKERIIEREDDVFMFKIDEIDDVLYDMFKAWVVDIEPRGRTYWPPKLAERRRIYDVLKEWSPPKALGAPPKVVTEPFTVMLWGITSDSVAAWLGVDESGADEVTGMAASPGIAEGLARVVRSAEDIGAVEDGDILVAPITAPSWAPVFARATGIVTDIGGLMSHAAIVCREYQIPAVTGTGYGTRDIKTGDRVRVDGSTGTVTILERA
jgi:pyruvate, water dikinase